MADPTTDLLFMACIPYTLIQECPDPGHWSDPANFSDDPHDPGGATQCGIIQTEYDSFRRAEGLSTQSVKPMTQAEGYAIYYQNYWLPHCPKLMPGMNLAWFDAAVNEGPGEATKMLQFVLDIPSDGAWGPQTDAAVQSLILSGNLVVQIKAFTSRREAVYRLFAGYQYFGTDWERRSAEIGAQAVVMAQGYLASLAVA